MSADAQRFIRPAVAAANVAGLLISIYLTFVHFSAAQLVCTAGGAIDCERVISSGYGVIAGSAIPTAAAGILWFGVGTILAAVGWSSPDVAGIRRAQAAWSVVGLLAVLYLVFVEIVQLGAICIWCTAAHVLVLVIFVLTVTMRPAGAR